VRVNVAFLHYIGFVVFPTYCARVQKVSVVEKNVLEDGKGHWKHGTLLDRTRANFLSGWQKNFQQDSDERRRCPVFLSWNVKMVMCICVCVYVLHSGVTEQLGAQVDKVLHWGPWPLSSPGSLTVESCWHCFPVWQSQTRQK